MPSNLLDEKSLIDPNNVRKILGSSESPAALLGGIKLIVAELLDVDAFMRHKEGSREGRVRATVDEFEQQARRMGLL